MRRVTARLRYRGFDLRVEDGFDADAARAVVDRVLATAGDRVHFVMQAGSEKVFVKAEFRRPSDPLGKRLRPSRAVTEGRGLRAFAAAGVPVPRLRACGGQAAWRPRAGALLVTEKLPGHNVSATLQRRLRPDLVEAVAAALARLHAVGFVHGDAAIRNFLALPEGIRIVDVPRWGAWTPGGAEDDLVHVAGSARKSGVPAAAIDRVLDAYRDADPANAARLAAGWRDRVSAGADVYFRHLLDRDRTRQDRRARRAGSVVRSKSRGAEGA